VHPRYPSGVSGVGLHSMVLSLREVVAVIEWLDVDRSHGAVWNWTHTVSETQTDQPTAPPSAGRHRRDRDHRRRREKVALWRGRYGFEVALGGRRVLPARDRPHGGVHESEALVQHSRTLRVLRTAFLHRLTENTTSQIPRILPTQAGISRPWLASTSTADATTATGTPSRTGSGP
jgi:hypothetical protein